MRRIININNDWYFSKKAKEVPSTKPSTWHSINVPHTWNVYDGADGGSDYYRGKCFYFKKLVIPYFHFIEEDVFLEFNGVNSNCKIYLDGNLIGQHSGGYSTFRIKLDTSKLKKLGNNLVLEVDNIQDNNIYPLDTDYTQYGGIYRDVNIIIVNKSHIDLEHYSSNGVYVDYTLYDDYAIIKAKVYTKNALEKNLSVEISKKSDKVIAYASTIIKDSYEELELIVKDPILWDGTINPYLYKATFSIESKNLIIDEISVNFGFRTYKLIDQNTFMLNEKEYSLRGVSKHQDRFGKGSAVSDLDQKQDLDLIYEMGANAIRLSHYQHPKFTYQYADEKGLILWSEIPLIKSFNTTQISQKNLLNQLSELILQNYNHPSIFFWGLANGLNWTDKTGVSACELITKLHERAKLLDQDRLTFISQKWNTPIQSELNNITDLVAYNLYFGSKEDNLVEFEKWFVDWKSIHNQKPIALGKYGTNSIVRYHAKNPKVGDYTEEFQASYHEYILRNLCQNRGIWATFVWNMFDFGNDALEEGNTPGTDNKGLVTFDRKIKKDSYYLYKAFWSFKKFVYIASRRRAIREQSENMIVKIYSNLEEVSLFIDGSLIETKKANKVFEFNVGKLELGVHFIEANASAISDIVTIEVVNDNYHHYKENKILK
ncbi:glycoside hydrolase family 2 protein [Mycoplasmopsis alligatoris]|uniref:Glycosyl hydrolase family 2, sugar binding domain protein n=1 Tax=Mycoplasmopsis alligatoris A21JP2 TaxID=747682 RepID=D4XUZ5_9BACT|nr:glycoside hydrolase family 2 [Mycoplasmopsis alligatoris]EFF41837.1 glycosyl hydrolase family 2, sugar binding domain protein [Mycoplasmopsis alligatoris A21JP2]